MNLPKTIHYCWFGGKPLPASARKCIASWRRYLPDYEIKEWNESNFDVNIIPYTREAYEAKKYAFVSDYARFWILYRYGGLYFDVDVEAISSFDDIVAQGPFMGFEVDGGIGRDSMAVAPGLGLGVNPGLGLMKEMLDLYATLHFRLPDGTLNLHTVVEYTTDVLRQHGLQDIAGIQDVAGVRIYPTAYFCPVSVADGKLRLSVETHSIHHYAQSWQSPLRKYGRKVAIRLGGKNFKDKLKRWIYGK